MKRFFPAEGKPAREGDMLSGVSVLVVALATLIVIWICVLVGSPYFGSPQEH
jgi:hypothetical protein